MFKKLLLLFLLCSLMSFAAFQYEIVTTPYDKGKKGNYFYINVTSGSGTIYILDEIKQLNNMTGNKQVLANVMSDYGYIDMFTGDFIAGTGNTIIANQHPNNQSNGFVYQTGYEVGTFSAGDSLGLWIKNKNGVLNTSIDTEYSNSGGYGLENKPDAFGTILAEFSYKGSAPISFGIDGVSGQPLPGAIASLMLATGAMGYCRRNRKKKQGN